MNDDLLDRLRDFVLFEKVTPELHLKLDEFLKAEVGGEWETYIQIRPNGDTVINCHRNEPGRAAGNFTIELNSEEMSESQ